MLPGSLLFGSSQERLATPINETVFKELLEGAPNPAEKARLLSVSGLRASSWLSVMPSSTSGSGCG